MIEFRLLGQIRLMAANGQDIDAILRQPKRLALLAYLAAPAPGTWHRRDLLLALFWPDLDAAHARTSLRSSLYVLRQTLGDEVLKSRGDEEVSVNSELMSTDLAAVWEALKNGYPEEALTHYGGDLLPGLFPSGSDGFQRWLDGEQTRLKIAISTSATERLAELEHEGRLSDALAIARRLIEIEPDDETIVRRVMSLHDGLGDRAGALAVFEGYRARLASDFEAEPSSETVALANRLRASSGIPASRTTVPVKTAVLNRPTVELHPAPSHNTGADFPIRATRSSHPRTWIFASTALIALAIVAVIAWNSSSAARPLSIGTSSPLTTEEGLQIEAAVSPNGRLVAYAKGNSNHLKIFVQKIGGGPAWALTDDSLSFEILPRWSPDNDALLFLSHNNAYVSPALGGMPRLLARGTEADGKIRSASWSPKGDSIAIVHSDSLTVRPLRGSGSRYIGNGSQLHSCVWSPDGKWIACTSGNWVEFEPGALFGNEAPTSVILFPAAGGKSIDLTGNEFQNRSPAWSPDGKFLWILSNRNGVTGEVYAIPIGRDGHVSGSFVRVGLRAEWIGLSAGRIAYSVPARKVNVWSVPIPADTPIALAAATRVTSGNQVVETVSTSRDGKWLAYASNLQGNSDIYRVPTAGGPPEQLTDDPRPEFAGELSPNNLELAWHRWVNGERHIFVKRLDADSAQEILPVPGDQGVPRWSPDGTALVAWSHGNEEGAIFVIRRDDRGKWRPSWRLMGAQLPLWSPDGRTIAFVRYDGRIETIPADSGARRTIYAPRPHSDEPIARFLAWKNAGTIWLIGDDRSGNGGIWSLPSSGGRPRLLVRLYDASGRFSGPSLAADNLRFFFTLDERSSNVSWAELVQR